MTKNSIYKKLNLIPAILYAFGMYLWIFACVGAFVFGSIGLTLKIFFGGPVILAIIGLFVPQEIKDRVANRVVYGTPSNNNTPINEREETIQNPDWDNDYEPIQYDQDDTYDNFYTQREDEYRQEYGDDAEDAIDDAWEEHQRNSRYR